MWCQTHLLSYLILASSLSIISTISMGDAWLWAAEKWITVSYCAFSPSICTSLSTQSQRATYQCRSGLLTVCFWVGERKQSVWRAPVGLNVAFGLYLCRCMCVCIMIVFVWLRVTEDSQRVWCCVCGKKHCVCVHILAFEWSWGHWDAVAIDSQMLNMTGHWSLSRWRVCVCMFCVTGLMYAHNICNCQ